MTTYVLIATITQSHVDKNKQIITRYEIFAISNCENKKKSIIHISFTRYIPKIILFILRKTILNFFK